jgi:phospholipase/carboxylesterase
MAGRERFSLTHLSRPPLRAGEGKAPGLLLLHGVGSNEEDLIGLAPSLDPRLHIISARAPFAMGPGMFGWYNLQVLPNNDFLINEEEARQSARLVNSFLDEIVDAYEIDPARLFLGGFSQGAIQSCAALLLEPEKVAGVVSMSGRWPELVEEQRASDERLAGKPVLAVHGLYDPIIPIRYARVLKEKFEALPVEFTYQEFPMQHNVSVESLMLANRWLTGHLDRTEA